MACSSRLRKRARAHRNREIVKMARVRIADEILLELSLQNESEYRNPLGVSSVDGR
jgi:hypothetical protein